MTLLVLVAAWSLRIAFITLMPAARLPERVRAALRHVAPAALAALVVTGLAKQGRVCGAELYGSARKLCPTCWPVARNEHMRQLGLASGKDRGPKPTVEQLSGGITLQVYQAVIFPHWRRCHCWRSSGRLGYPTRRAVGYGAVCRCQTRSIGRL